LVLERQLRLKFGALPDEVQRRIEQASEQTLLTCPSGSLPPTVLMKFCA